MRDFSIFRRFFNPLAVLVFLGITISLDTIALTIDARSRAPLKDSVEFYLSILQV